MKTDFENIFAKARRCLQLSFVPESLPCREDEREEISKFVRQHVFSKEGGCMCKDTRIPSFLNGKISDFRSTRDWKNSHCSRYHDCITNGTDQRGRIITIVKKNHPFPGITTISIL
jgi:hypothetical protein